MNQRNRHNRSGDLWSFFEGGKCPWCGNGTEKSKYYPGMDTRRSFTNGTAGARRLLRKGRVKMVKKPRASFTLRHITMDETRCAHPGHVENRGET